MTEPSDKPPAAAPKKATPPTKKATTPKKDAAPKKATPPRLGSSSGRAGRPSKADLVGKLATTIRDLADKLQLAGMLTGNEAWSYDGLVLDHFADDLAAELYDLASHNPRLAELLEKMYETSSRFGSLQTVIAVAVPIAVAHGRLPAWAIKGAGAKGKALVAAIGEPPTPPAPPTLAIVRDPEPATTPPAPAPWQRPPAGDTTTPAPEPEGPADPTDPTGELDDADWFGDHTTPIGVGDPTATIAEPATEQFSLGWAPSS